jgi:hypothetical protein
MDEQTVVAPVAKRKYTKKTKEAAQAEALSGFDYAKFGTAMALAIKEGNRDRAKEERDEKHRLRMRAQMQEDGHNRLRKWRQCSHMRSHPYSGTSRIAWATQSDGNTRGTCMACACPFSPIAQELPFPVEMRDWYERMIAVPMTAAQNDFVTGMVAAGTPA